MSTLRYFLTYSGVSLPLKLVSPLEDHELGHRNTYMRAEYDGAGRMVRCEKMVYGAVELTHCYHYDAQGTLHRAEIIIDDETNTIEFDVRQSIS